MLSPIAVFDNGRPHSTNYCCKFTDPGVTDGMVDRARRGIKPGPARLMVQQIRRRATVSIRRRRQSIVYDELQITDRLACAVTMCLARNPI